MHLINKIFYDKTIRTIWDKEPRKYWNWFKNKLKKEEDFEVSSITRQLKLRAQDGK